MCILTNTSMQLEYKTYKISTLRHFSKDVLKTCIYLRTYLFGKGSYYFRMKLQTKMNLEMQCKGNE